MAWFLIGVLTTVLVLALPAVITVAGQLAANEEDERARIEAEVRRAERRLHDVASTTFRSMLEEARVHDGEGRRWTA